MAEDPSDLPVDRDLAAVARLLGDPARAAMIEALAGGVALPAGELARLAGVTPATATGHLRRLIDGGVLTVYAQGRHRYHRLAGPEVAAALEAVARISSPVPVRSLRQHRHAMRIAEARTCYDHLAGRRGVQLRDRLLQTAALAPVNDRDHVLTDRGRALLHALQLDAEELQARPRVFARVCLDFTQRRPHLAGALPAAITARFLELGWIARADGRGLRISHDYDAHLTRWLSTATP